MANVKASDILMGIRKKYVKLAVIREVTVPDPFEQAIYYRWKHDSSKWYAEWIQKQGIPIADVVPEGWKRQDSKLERRIDALILTQKVRTAVEIKVSRADFKRDTYEKRAAWMHYTHKFVYATPKGLITKDEVPEGCGWWEYDPDAAGTGIWQHGITVGKNAKTHTAVDLPDAVTVSMLGRLSRYELAGERNR